MKRVVLFLAAVLVMAGTPAWAIDFTITGEQLTVTYTEPTKNVDGTPLTDLNLTTIYYNRSGGPIRGATVPATSASGGGAISQVVTIPTTPPEEFDVEVWATASDQFGNEGPESSHVTKRIDQLPPGAPQ